MKQTKSAAEIYAASGPQLEGVDLGQITEPVNELVFLLEEQNSLEEELNKVTTRIATLQTKTIPEILGKFNIEQFTTGSGVRVTVKPFYNGKIVEGKERLAFAWLDSNGHGGLIKTEVSVPFPKGMGALAKQLYKELTEKPEYAMAELSEGVHAQTLKAFVKEQMEAGKPLPQDLFNVFCGKTTKVEIKR